MSHRRPLIGISPDVQWRAQERPPRDYLTLDAQLPRALMTVGATPVILTHEVEGLTAVLERLDGVVISGGDWQFPHPRLIDPLATEPADKLKRARFEISLAREALARDVPVLGICGGFQVLNAVTGGDLVVDLATQRREWAHHRGRSYDEVAHDVIVEPGSRFAGFVGVEQFAVNSRHRQGVLATGTGAQVAARSSDGLVEALEVPDAMFCIGTQWHPEFLLHDADRCLLEALVNACRP
jgi:putative glutamine amidotransferase